jgi:hypothetical protein
MGEVSIVEENSITLKLGMGEYNLSSLKHDIPIRGVDIVLGIQWLRTIGTVFTNYNKLFMSFEFEGIQYELKGLKYSPS